MPQGDAKVLGSPQEISLSLTCLLSPGFWGTPSIPHSARQLCRLLGENKCPRCFVSVTNETQVREQGTQGHGLTSKSFLFPICRHPCKTSCAWEGARESQRVRTARAGRFASPSQQGRQRSEGWRWVRGDSPWVGEVCGSAVSGSISVGLDLSPCWDPLVRGHGGVLLCNSKAEGSALARRTPARWALQQGFSWGGISNSLPALKSCMCWSSGAVFSWVILAEKRGLGTR